MTLKHLGKQDVQALSQLGMLQGGPKQLDRAVQVLQPA